VEPVLDRSKLPSDLRVQMVWAPREVSDPVDSPIALVRDRRRFLLSAIPMVLAFLVAIFLLLVLRTAQLLAGVVLVLILLAGNRVAQGGKTGYYEVRPDGSLGTFLGRRMPYALRSMERIKPE
jgi:hypothetical protein